MKEGKGRAGNIRYYETLSRDILMMVRCRCMQANNSQPDLLEFEEEEEEEEGEGKGD